MQDHIYNSNFRWGPVFLFEMNRGYECQGCRPASQVKNLLSARNYNCSGVPCNSLKSRTSDRYKTNTWMLVDTSFQIQWAALLSFLSSPGANLSSYDIA